MPPLNRGAKGAEWGGLYGGMTPPSRLQGPWEPRELP